MNKNSRKSQEPKKLTPKKNKYATTCFLTPEFHAGLSLTQILPSVWIPDEGEWKADANIVASALTEEMRKLRNNDLSRIEDILFAQVQTLDVLFHKCLKHAFSCDNLDGVKQWTDVAFKAQRQCRASAETLSLVKNPQPYVRQQNVAINQQVNNQDQTPLVDSLPARAGNTKFTNELLTDKRGHHEKLDAGRSATAGADDKELATVETFHGSKKP